MASVEPILDPAGLGDSGQEDLRELSRALESFRDPQVKEKAPYLQRIVSRHASLFGTIVKKLGTGPLSREERCFLRCGLLDTSLIADDLRPVVDTIVDDEPDDSGIYYVDEWLQAVASGTLSASTQDEAVTASYKQGGRPTAVRRQEAQANLSAQEDAFRLMLARVEEAHQGIMAALTELTDGFRQMQEILPLHGPVPPGHEEAFAKLRQSRSSAVAGLLAAAGKVSALDRSVLTEYRGVLQARSTLEALGGGAEETESAGVDTARLSGEMDVVRQMMKMCVGPRGNPFPILVSDMIRGRPDDLLNTRQSIREQMEHIERTDPGVFLRRFKGADQRFVPYVVIVPVYGQRGICWEPWPRQSKGLPGRVVVPLTANSTPNIAAVSAIASYRWVAAKEQAMHYWMEEGLTGQYYQLHIADKHFRHEPEFIKDYTLWVTEECQGRPRLNGATRAAFWRYIPFPKEVRDALAARGGMYRDLVEKDQRRASSRYSGLGQGE
jgi:hypothetical protein